MTSSKWSFTAPLVAKLRPIKHHGAQRSITEASRSAEGFKSGLPLFSSSWLAGSQGLTLREQLVKYRFGYNLPKADVIA